MRFLISERTDVKKNMTEGFGYDNLNRMQSVQLNNGPLKSMEYFDNGNINVKYDNGSYQYHAQKIHAVETVTGGSDTFDQEITYNALNKTSTIEQGDIQYEFKYGTDGQHRKMQRRLSGTLNLDRTYSHNYLRETIGANTKETHYIPTPTGVSAIFVKENGNTGNMYYLCSDHLGSITDVVNASGAVVESFSFDPWGRRRNAGNWNDYNVNTGSNSLVSRGYTGHEHLDDVGLINMNGRMYDPLLGRMLSPDNLIPNPFSLQGYNRYSYVYNNPMNFTDPSGENPIVWILAGLILIGKSYHDGYKANNNEPNPLKWDWKNADYNVGYSYGGSGHTGWGSVGWGNDGVAFGYNSQQGWGAGVSNNGSPSLYYPKYNYNAPEQGAEMAYNNLIQEYFDYKNMETEWAAHYAGIGTSVASEIFYSKDFGTWMGKDFQFRTIYGRAGNGNQYVGGKYKFGKNVSDGFKWGNRAVALYKAGDIYSQYTDGNISGLQFVSEEISNVLSTALPGLHGLAWSVGWESGRKITNQYWYQQAKFNFFYNYWERRVGPPSPNNIAEWEYFYNNYRP